MDRSSKTEHKDSTEFLEGIISEWRTVFDSITDLVSVLDTDYRFIRVNRPFAKYVGVEPQDIIGKKCHKIMHGTDKPVSYCPIAKSTNLKKPVQKEVYDSVLDKHFMISLSPIIGADGNVKSIVHIMRDITEKKQWEEKLENREKQLLESQRVAKLGSWEWDIVNNKITWSDELYRIFGVKPEEFEASYEAFLSMVHPDDKEKLDDAVKESLNKKKPYHIDVRINRSDGSEWIMEARGELTLNENGDPVKIGGTAQDITERKKAVEDINLFQNLINQSNDAIFVIDTDTSGFLNVNDKACSNLGFSRDELLKMGVIDIEAIVPDDFSWVEHMTEVRKEGYMLLEGTHKRKDGTTYPAEVNAKLVYINNKEYMVSVVRDITERRKAEMELRESEEKYRKLIETANDAIFLADTESGIIVDANKKAEELLGIPLDEIKGMHQTQLHPEEELENYRKIFQKHVKEGNAFITDLLVVHRSGKLIPVDISASMIEIGGKTVLQGVFRDLSDRKKAEDELRKHHNELELRVQERTLEIEKTNEKLLKQISDRKEAEEALRESEMRFRVAATAISDLLWEGDVRNNSLNWYGDIDRHLGYEEGEFPRTISGHVENIHKDDRDLFIKSVDRALETGKDFRAEYRIRCKDGTYRYWDETGKAIEYEDGKAVKWIGAVTDISDRKMVEEQIMQSEEQFKKLSQEFNALLDVIPDNIVLLDADLKILWANKASSQKFKKKNNMLEGEHCYEMCCNISSPCEDCPALISFKTGKEETVRRLGPSGIFWDIRTFPITDEQGKVKNVIEVARDVSARIQLEKEANALQAKLIHANKMTSLGTLVSGVAHEINNPNSFIMTNADLFSDIWNDSFKLLNKLDDEYKQTQVGGVPFSDLGMVVPKLLRGIYEGSGRIKSIVDNLRDFAKSDRGDLDESVDVNKAVRAASNILDSHIKKFTDHYHLSCRDNIPFIKGNSQQIEQVIINLIINSLQALPDRESCVLVSTYLDIDNDMVIIKIEDEGTGISESNIERITEPFFTTKMESGGTGLGLSISYAIIKEHKGFLEFRSYKNKRTVAYIKLPAIDNRNE